MAATPDSSFGKNISIIPVRAGVHLFVVLASILFSACSPKPKVEDVGLSEESFRTLHYQILYDFFGGQGFDKANLTPHSHHLIDVQDIQKVFVSSEADLTGVLFVDYTDPEQVEISPLTTDQDEDGRTRTLSDDEKTALESLLSKKVSYAGYQKKGSGINALMWPIRAMNETCVACHGGDKGALLGAVVYQFRDKASD